MNGPQLPSDAERELSDLRARAYGRDHDIEADPAALARLVELENALIADTAASTGAEPVTPAAEAGGTAPTHSPSEADRGAPAGTAMDDGRSASSRRGFWPSLWRRATATSPGRLSLRGASGVLLLIVVYVVTWLEGAAPDATLRPLADKGDRQLIQLMGAVGLSADMSTLRRYESYRGVEPWSVVDPDGHLCLMAVDRARTVIYNTQCVPPGAELFVNLGAWPRFNDAFAKGLPDGSVIRWHLREDAVDVFVYPA